MDSHSNSIPGYRVFEYLLVLNPHEELRHRVMQVKKDFFEKYEAESALSGKPQVGIASFSQYAMMEERILHRLRVVAMGITPFKVELRDFGSFPAHTIFINVVSKLPVQGLIRTVRAETQRLMKLNDENKPYFMMEPHLTIARKLKPWQFEQAWREYAQKNFSGRFIADSMTLLKRPAAGSGGNRAKYQIVERFEFQNMPVTTKQGELFG